MAEARSRKISILIFLFALFILLSVFTGSWIVKMYKEQTSFSEKKTLKTVECGRYYYTIKSESVIYENGTLYFEIENTLGSDIASIGIESMNDRKEVLLGLGQGMSLPVSVPIDVAGWVMVYPTGCEGINFRNLSFEPRT